MTKKEILPVLQNSYLALRKIPIEYRINVQKELSQLRDTIAELINKTPMQVQEYYDIIINNELWENYAKIFMNVQGDLSKLQEITGNKISKQMQEYCDESK